MNGEFIHIRAAESRSVLLAMSGGVDSAVSALTLVQAGHRVVGLTMKNYCYGDFDAAVPERSCCSTEAIDDARAVCQRIGIRHMVVSTEELFGREVYRNFIDEYRRARTPNPCVRCNSIVRFETLVQWADHMGFDAVATGHYARVFRSQEGRHYVARSTSRAKDQSYFLSALDPAVLPRVMFPLGDREKDDVRAHARDGGLKVADKPDSQEVCFIATRTLKEFLDGKVEMVAGDVVNTAGEILGRHDGLATYTIGQRRGLGIAAGKPQYVVGLDAATNTVVLGDDEDLFQRELECELAWLDERAALAASPLRAQIRSRHEAQAVRIVSVHGPKARVAFDTPQRAMAPGQTVALYDGDVVVGSGVISAPGPA
ncbi:MAG TPA: tRNA 2-thiouridine(34) synthase MnmA [Candidatus Krumholzibacteria bacterium]|nr:tRNA 2-thiouridine(34) synthase MnmA [Candidatus Krumholzibacteria bacterium]